MEAIVLAGGFGTRLRHVVSDVPKPMAPINNRPFLQYILDLLKRNGVTRVVLATGYMSEVIENYFGNEYNGMELIYSVETTPLFTGGAIKKALQMCSDESVFVFNGDTFFDVDLKQMRNFHEKNNSVLTIAAKFMTDFERYGSLDITDNRIWAFREKQKMTEGYINGGVYLMKKELLSGIAEEKFSFENDFMEKHTNIISIHAFPCDGYFIDIGIPEDYAKVQTDFQKFGW